MRRGDRPACRRPLLELAVWMADDYGSTLARALALVIPPRPPKRALKARGAFAEPRRRPPCAG